MTAEYMNLTAQAATSHWGWTIAFFLWFVGLSGMSLFLNYWVRSRRIHYAATAAAVVGTLLVVSHLGRILNLPAAAFNALIHWSFGFTSWMFIGICILAVLCVVTVLQAWLMTKGSALGMRCGLLAFDAVLGVAATAYSGFLLTQAVGVPLWTTAAIPVLWIFSGLACAVGLIEILAAAGKLDAESPRWLHAAGWARRRSRCAFCFRSHGAFRYAGCGSRCRKPRLGQHQSAFLGRRGRLRPADPVYYSLSEELAVSSFGRRSCAHRRTLAACGDSLCRDI